MEQESSEIKAQPDLPGNSPVENTGEETHVVKQEEKDGNDNSAEAKPETKAVQPDKSAEQTKQETKDIGEKFDTAGIWSQLLTHTKNIEIGEDESFYWPARREETELVIGQLKAKHLLFIRSIDESWMYPAVERLATMLQANGHIEKLFIRINKSSYSTDKQDSKKLEFGFWVNQPRLPFPTIVFISSEGHDFIEKFIGSSNQKIQNELITGLKKANLYLVCQVDDKKQERAILDQFQKRTESFSAFWQLPCFKLQVKKMAGKKGEEIIRGVTEKGLMNIDADTSLYEGLFKVDLNSSTEISDELLSRVRNFGVDIEEKRDVLINIMTGDDFLSKLAVFCAAFFDGLYYPDFKKLVEDIIQSENAVSGTPVPVSAPSQLSIAPAAVKGSPSLAEQWRLNHVRILKQCFIETRLEAGNQRVVFAIPKLAEIMSRYIQEHQFSFFYDIYIHFDKIQMLSDPDLSEKMEPLVIRFFSVAAQMDSATHDAYWLKEMVHAWWRTYENHLPENLSYEQVRLYLLKERKLFAIIYSRIPLIIGGLLKNNNRHFKDIVKDFFRMLLDESGTKKMAVIIASYLYKAYRYTDTFPAEDLQSYFKRTLEGDWMESFFAYDAMEESMDYKELWKLTTSWINDETLSDKSGAKKFAMLYQVDYILVTVYRYFRQFKTEETYELWEKEIPGNFPETFKELMQRLLSKQSIESMDKILCLGNDEGQKRFKNYVRYFEAVESKRNLAVFERFIAPCYEAYTLVADIVETWFYILVHKEELPDQENSAIPTGKGWQNYAALFTQYCHKDYSRQIRKYWSLKLRMYNQAVTNYKNQGKGYKKEEGDYIAQLRKRKSSLKILMDLVREELTENL